MTVMEFSKLLAEALVYGSLVAVFMGALAYRFERKGDDAILSALAAAVGSLILVAIAVFASAYV